MPKKTTRLLHARRPIASRTAHDLRRAFRLKRTHVVASALGFLLFGSVPAWALELGDASLKSRLGQALVVEIPYRLAANEQLTPSCIGLVPARGNADSLPPYTQVSRVSISPTHIQILGMDRVLEPLIGLNVDVRCATVPRFLRSYQLLVDLPSSVPFSAPAEPTRAAAATQPAASEAVVPGATRATDAPTPRARGREGGDIAQGQTYRVVSGDTLSGIAARIAGRPGSIHATAEAVFAANPDAFARGDRDRLVAGRSIVIPVMTSSVAQPLADAPNDIASATSDARPASAPLPAVETLPAGETQPAVQIQPAVETLPSTEVLPAATSVADEPSAASAPDAAIAPLEAAVETAPTARSSVWLSALLALGAAILLSAPLVLLRRQRPQPTGSQPRGEARKAAPRGPSRLVSGIEVVESPPAPAAADEMVTMPSTALGSADRSHAAAASPTIEIELPIDPTGTVDMDVGVPVVLEERVDWFEQRAMQANQTVVGGDTVEENAATARVPDLDTAVRTPPPATIPSTHARVDDDAMTLTVTELDMLREDYEIEHTLTQQASKALQEAVADLEATKASLAAAAETAELPQASPAETVTARVRAK